MQNGLLIFSTPDQALRGYREFFPEEGGMVLLGLCEESAYRFEADGRWRILPPHSLLICPPGMRLSLPALGPGGSVKWLGVRYAHFLRSIKTGFDVWSILLVARSRPVFPLSEADSVLTRRYYDVIQGKLNTARSYYYDEILLALSQCVIYEICLILTRSIRDLSQEEGTSGRKDVLFKQFMGLLSADGGRVRRVDDYADRLCVTPKYLSSVVREFCGAGALQLILENAGRHIWQALRFSPESIKEIAQEFGFPDVSVFGKFVKSRFGMSPRQIRKSGEDLHAR